MGAGVSAARRPLLRVTRFFFMIGAKDNSKETAMWHFTWSTGIAWMPAIAAAVGSGVAHTMLREATGKRARESHRATVRAKDNRS
ncbi:MAG: hypothetical protein CPSOU_3368 [uncultured Paraburkholderia sp.]|nr:MAG: hypothetical protein CPSOU_3368 [uncultured Paraburkholderia sp.]